MSFFSLELLLWQNNLARQSWLAILVHRFWNRFAEDANGADDLSDDLCPGRLGVGWVANHHLALGDFISRLDTTDLSILTVDEAIHRLVEHVSTSVNCRKTRETFRQSAQTIHWVNERRTTILHHRIQVQLAGLDCWTACLVHVSVVALQGNGVANEVNGPLLKPELLVDLGHGVPPWVDLLMR